MAAKSKKRLSKNENKLNKLDKLEIKDLVCSICQSILIEPVTLPCYHDFCHRCFRGSIENNALCCPLCRLRIGSWVRTATKNRTLINTRLWDFIQNKFYEEVNKKLRGEDECLLPETPLPRLSKPGEIRSEYEAELQRLRAERLRLEQEHIHETQILIHRLKQEEEEAHKKYIESLKNDEMLAKKLQCEGVYQRNFKISKRNKTLQKSRLKPVTIDSYMSKLRSKANGSLSTEDTIVTHESNSKVPSKLDDISKPEPHNNNSKINNLDIRTKDAWNKENGKNLKLKKDSNDSKETTNDKATKTKNGIQSLLVSLPLPSIGIIPQKAKVVENRSMETGSVDSMQQELCYFKPIEETTTTSYKPNSMPLRVPGLRLENGSKPLKQTEAPPSRAQYIESLCRLRSLSLAQKLPSAFVIALSILWSKQENRGNTSSKRSKLKRTRNDSPSETNNEPSKKDKCNKKLTVETDRYLRRTRSMGSITKNDNETTPKKKLVERKISSERKPHLRSDTKRNDPKSDMSTPNFHPKSINNNKVKLEINSLSNRFDDCDVKHILQEQLRIETMYQQEKNDYELACKMDAEWNGRRQPRRSAAKRQITLNNALIPAKKVKL